MIKKKLFKKIAIGIAFGLSVSIVTPVSMPTEQIKVEAAKKDKKKPKIKLSGAKELTATVGEQVTIPATTYSDNKTKKKKLKVGVTVKKGKKNYKALASKIRKATLKSKPVSVTFDEEGIYKITTTVTDLAKNKATAVRTVTITPKRIEEQVITKQDPEVTTTTEQPKQEEPKREEKTTEEPKKEDKEWPIYNYNVITNKNMDESTYEMLAEGYFSDKIDLTLENDFSQMIITKQSDMLRNGEYLKFVGKITATDQYGKDISDKIVIYEDDLKERTTTSDYGCLIYIFVEDDYGNRKQKFINITFMEDPYLKPEDLNDLQIINNNPKVYIRIRKHEDYSYNKNIFFTV